jgi:predicted nucleic acid-binding protein
MPTHATLAARLEVQSLALQEILRALAPAQADQVANRLREQVAMIVDAKVPSEEADAAVAGELSALLDAAKGIR